jgi:hypothetical protein
MLMHGMIKGESRKQLLCIVVIVITCMHKHEADVSWSSLKLATDYCVLSILTLIHFDFGQVDVKTISMYSTVAKLNRFVPLELQN